MHIKYMLWFESCLLSHTVQSPHSIFPRTGKRPRSRRLGCPAPISGQQFAAFRYFGRGFRAPVSARYFPISVSGEGRLVRLLAETNSTRDRVKLIRPIAGFIVHAPHRQAVVAVSP